MRRDGHTDQGGTGSGGQAGEEKAGAASPCHGGKLPLLVMAGTFIASVVFKINIMQIIAVDAIIGLLLMRDPQYD